MNHTEKEYRRERALFNLVKASNEVLDGNYAVALIWVGLATVQISQLAGETGTEQAYRMVKKLVEKV